jgi:hypothetical protein
MTAVLAPPVAAEHVTPHAWPATTDQLQKLAACRTCGRATLRLFIESANWVGRRVETIEFLDDRTVRRRVSVNYVVPETSLVLQRGSDAVRILPIAALRRKSLINFHFKDQDDRPIPLLGLRENQAITLSLISAWAALALDAGPGECRDLAARFTPDSKAYGVIKDIVEGDQDELNNAWFVFQGTLGDTSSANAPDDGLSDIDRRMLACLRADPCFGMVFERLAHNWLLLASDGGVPGEHRIVKFSYDEPLTARYSDAGYKPHPKTADGGDLRPRYELGRRRGWRHDLLAGLGLRAALVRLPVPGAELASSYHLEVAAPHGASIVEASLLAGLPNLYGDPTDSDPEADRGFYKDGYAQDRIDPRRRRRRPSYDVVGPSYPTIDLHVADVPYGSLSRAQVLLRGRPQGWLAASAACSWVALVALWGTSRSHLDNGVAATLLITLAAAIITLVVREDEHRMVTRLLGVLKLVSAVSIALLVIAAVVAVTFDERYRWVRVLAWISAGPVLLTTLAWGLSIYSLRDLGGRDLDRRLVQWLALRGGAYRQRDRRSPDDGAGWRRALAHPVRLVAEGADSVIRHQMFIRESPWEQYPIQRQAEEATTTMAWQRREEQRGFAAALDRADFPYDHAVELLRFDRPAIRVASAEGSRITFTWNVKNRREFMRRLRDADIPDADNKP